MKEAKKYTDEQLEKTLNLAQKIKVIQNNKSLTRKQKKKTIRQLLKGKKKYFLRMIYIFLHKKIWTERSWTVRLVLIAAIPGIIKGGSVGLATMGIGIAIPMFLVTALGGMFVGVIIEEIKNKKSN